MGRISLERALQALEEVAAEQPRHVDPRSKTQGSARYTSCGQPACLVAAVLAHLGFSPKSLALLDQEYKGRPISFKESSSPIVQKLSRPARDLLDHAQGLQDSGLSWARSAEWAADRYRRRR